MTLEKNPLSYKVRGWRIKQEFLLKIALSIQQDRMAPTLGSSEELLLWEEDSSRPVPLPGNIPLFLKQNKVDVLICNGIGCCMKELLSSMKIAVLPGVSGKVREVLTQYRSGTLKEGENYSCADHSRTCGECPGIY